MKVEKLSESGSAQGPGKGNGQEGSFFSSISSREEFKKQMAILNERGHVPTPGDYQKINLLNRRGSWGDEETLARARELLKTLSESTPSQPQAKTDSVEKRKIGDGLKTGVAQLKDSAQKIAEELPDRLIGYFRRLRKKDRKVEKGQVLTPTKEERALKWERSPTPEKQATQRLIEETQSGLIYKYMTPDQKETVHEGFIQAADNNAQALAEAFNVMARRVENQVSRETVKTDFEASGIKIDKWGKRVTNVVSYAINTLFAPVAGLSRGIASGLANQRWLGYSTGSLMSMEGGGIVAMAGWDLASVLSKGQLDLAVAGRESGIVLFGAWLLATGAMTIEKTIENSAKPELKKPDNK